jgi:hypothetical protein
MVLALEKALKAQLDISSELPLLCKPYASGKKMQVRMFTAHSVVQRKIVDDWVLIESLGLSASWSRPEHSRLGGQFLALAKRCVIPGL